LVVGSAAGSAACKSSSSGGTASSPLCTGTGRCIVFSPGESESSIEAAFAEVKDGDTLVFDAGTYSFVNQLGLGTANNVSVVGAGPGKTILDFSKQLAAEDGLFAQSVQNLRFEGFTIKDAPGNGTKVLSVTGMTFRSLEVTWTAMDTSDGAYAIYPVQSTDVLIENCTVSGASDSGIYVGQSQNIVVRNNTATLNVAGIEIENSFNADVYENDSHDNTAGILVFDLPGLQQEGGHAVRIFDNQMVNNNTASIAASDDIVSLVPAGTGFFVMANHDVEVFGNTISGNETVAAAIVSYAITQMAFTDPVYYEWPSLVYLHDNTYANNGSMPTLYNQIGLLLNTGLSGYPEGHVPDVMWDGIADPDAGTGPNPMQLCIQEPGASAVCDMHFDKLDPNNPMVLANMVCDAGPFNCTSPVLPPVTWTGLSAPDGGVPGLGGSGAGDGG
jgi:parallel beta-helix repeat protein